MALSLTSWKHRPVTLLPALMALALICAITSEELLGYNALVIGGVVVDSYFALCSLQTLFALALMTLGPKVAGLARNLPLLAFCAIVSFLGSAFGSIDNENLSLLSLAGFILLCFASFALKVSLLELFAEIAPATLPALLFSSFLLQSLLAPLLALPSWSLWALSGGVTVLGFALTAAGSTLRLTEQSSPAPSGTFRRSFSASVPVLAGAGIICAGIAFLNPLSLYPSINPSDFISFTLATHLIGALVFGALALGAKDPSYAFAFKSINSLVLISFLLMALLGSDSVVPRALCTIVFSLFEFVVFLAVINLASYTRTNRLRLFGGFYLLVRASTIVGMSLGLMNPTVQLLGSDIPPVGIAVAVCCIIASLWLLTEPHLNQFFWGNANEEMEKCGEGTTFDLESGVESLAQAGSLTPRETEVLALVAQGRSSTFIAEELFVSSNTVRKHIAHIYEKLGVHSKQELLTLVQQAGLFSQG